MESPTVSRILIVEDDEAFRYVLEKKLIRAGFTVTVAVNGSHAIQILSSGKLFELVISDLKMPLKGGVDLLTHMQAHFPDVPVVILTGYPERQKIIAAAQLGCVDVLLKPVHTEKLLVLIEKKLGHSTGKKAV